MWNGLTERGYHVSREQQLGVSMKKKMKKTVLLGERDEKGNYKVTYKVTFSYKGNNITKTFTQSVMVY